MRGNVATTSIFLDESGTPAALTPIADDRDGAGRDDVGRRLEDFNLLIVGGIAITGEVAAVERAWRDAAQHAGIKLKKKGRRFSARELDTAVGLLVDQRILPIITFTNLHTGDIQLAEQTWRVVEADGVLPGAGLSPREVVWMFHMGIAAATGFAAATLQFGRPGSRELSIDHLPHLPAGHQALLRKAMGRGMAGILSAGDARLRDARQQSGVPEQDPQTFQRSPHEENVPLAFSFGIRGTPALGQLADIVCALFSGRRRLSEKSRAPYDRLLEGTRHWCGPFPIVHDLTQQVRRHLVQVPLRIPLVGTGKTLGEVPLVK